MRVNFDSSKYSKESVNKSTLSVLKHGEVLLAMLRQEQYKPRQIDQQVFELYVAKSKHLDEVEPKDVRKTLDDCYKFVAANQKDVFSSIKKNKEILPEIENQLKKGVDDYFASIKTK